MGTVNGLVEGKTYQKLQETVVFTTNCRECPLFSGSNQSNDNGYWAQ